MAIAYLLKQTMDVVYADNQLTAALDKLCCYKDSDEMTNIDVKMIKQALTKQKRSSNVIRYDEIISCESNLFLHIVNQQDGLKLACSKSTDSSHFSDAGEELSLVDTEAVYDDAAEGGWLEMS